jgi:hypothetical protein
MRKGKRAATVPDRRVAYLADGSVSLTGPGGVYPECRGDPCHSLMQVKVLSKFGSRVAMTNMRP